MRKEEDRNRDHRNLRRSWRLQVRRSSNGDSGGFIWSHDSVTSSVKEKKNSSNDSSIKFDLNKSSSDTKSIVPHFKLNSPTANFDVFINCCNKEERTRQVSENPVSSSIKTEIDHQQRHQSNISSLYLENNSPASLPIRLILQPGDGSAFRADVDIVSERNMIKKGQHKRCVTYCLMRMQYLKWWSSYSRACGGTLFTSM